MYELGTVCVESPAICVHPMGDKTRWQAVPLLKGHAGAQRVGACSTLLALLLLHVKELPLTTGKGYERKRKSEKRNVKQHSKKKMLK